MVCVPRCGEKPPYAGSAFFVRTRLHTFYANAMQSEARKCLHVLLQLTMHCHLTRLVLTANALMLVIFQTLMFGKSAVSSRAVSQLLRKDMQQR